MEEPPLLESENVNPDNDSQLTDSFNSKNGFNTPSNASKLSELKLPAQHLVDPNYENVLNPINNASASSKTSKEVGSPTNAQNKHLEVLPKPELEPELLLSTRQNIKEEQDVQLSNLNDQNVVDAPPLEHEVGSSFYDDSDSSEDEGLPDYKIGGYHPVHVGEIYSDRYIIIQKLGWGHFSTVWLSKDIKYDTYVAIKVQKSASHYIEAAYDEVEILDQVSSFWKRKEWQASLHKYYKDDPEKFNDLKNTSKYCHTVQLLNSFMHQGPNGLHFVMVFEILGVNLLEIIKRYDYKGVPLPLVRDLAKQCLVGLDYLHRM